MKGHTTSVLLNGVKAEALLDSGCFQCVALSSLIPEERWSRDKVPLTCIHGDEHKYPTAEVYLTVGGQTYLLSVALVDRLPYQVILGNDLPTLLELMSPNNQSAKEQVELEPIENADGVVKPVHVLTRAQNAKTLMEELPFWEEECEAQPRKTRKSKAQRRQEKFMGSPKEESKLSKPLIPKDFDMPLLTCHY